MKIKTSILIPTASYVLVLLAFNYFCYIIDFQIDRVNLIVFITGIGIIACGAYNEFAKKNINTIIVLCFFGMYLFEVVLSSIRYNQGFLNSLFADKFYLEILLYFTLIRVYKNESDKEMVLKIFVIVSLIVSILLDYQVLVLHPSGKEILYNIDYWKRSGGARVTASTHFIEMAVLVSVAKLLEKKKKNKELENKQKIWNLFYVFTIIFGLVDIILISKTRMSIILVFSAIGIMFVFRDIGNTKKNFFHRLIIFILALIAVHFILNVSPIASSFEDLSSGHISVSLRREEYIMYIGQLLQNPFNFIFGMGMIHDTNNTFLSSILGVNGTGGRTDVGAVGFVNEFGIIGLALYIWISLRGYKIIKECRKIDVNCMDLMAFWLYFILGSATLCMFNRARIIGVPIMLYLFDYYSKFIPDKKDIQWFR